MAERAADGGGGVRQGNQGGGSPPPELLLPLRGDLAPPPSPAGVVLRGRGGAGLWRIHRREPRGLCRAAGVGGGWPRGDDLLPPSLKRGSRSSPPSASPLWLAEPRRPLRWRGRVVARGGGGGGRALRCGPPTRWTTPSGAWGGARGGGGCGEGRRHRPPSPSLRAWAEQFWTEVWGAPRNAPLPSACRDESVDAGPSPPQSWALSWGGVVPPPRQERQRSMAYGRSAPSTGPLCSRAAQWGEGWGERRWQRGPAGAATGVEVAPCTAAGGCGRAHEGGCRV